MWTKKGVVVVSASGLAFLGGLVAASPPLVATGAALLAYLLVASFTKRHVELGVKRGLSTERLFEDEVVDVTLEVKNLSRHTGFLEVRDRLSRLVRVRNGSNYTVLDVKPGEEQTVLYEVECPLKGHYEVGPVEVRIEDVFGLFYEERRMDIPSYFTVFPRRESVRDVPVRSRYPMLFLGEYIVKQPGQGLEFFGLREYTHNDPLRAVNWKASARAGELIVNQRERESMGDATILFDARKVAGAGREDRNPILLGARAAATITSMFVKRRDRVRLVVYADKVHVVEPDTGERQLFKVLTMLAGQEGSGTTSLMQAVERTLPNLHPKSPVVLISPLDDDPTLIDAVSLLRAQESAVIVISVGTLDCLENGGLTEATKGVLTMERQHVIAELRGLGCLVLNWAPDQPLVSLLMKGATQ